MGTAPPGPPESRGRPSARAGGGAHHDDLSQRLADLARRMQHQVDTPAVLELIVASIAGTVPGAEEATISLVTGRRRVVSAAATDDLARRFDDLQQETRQGPCMDSMYERETVRVDDLATDQRWPALGRAAADAGLRSALCIQLFVQGEDLGAMNMLARTPQAFSDESERVGLLFASHAAIALAQAQKINHLELGMASRDLIGQAKGVLMERYKITSEQAFALLAKASQDANRKLVEVADHLTRTGVLGTEGPTGAAVDRHPARRGDRPAGP
ncbi:GAF and ANTAR domain-containing protein [Geodermatophilus sp. DSM 44513]|uniref:GAF and ANTAR domain-containing protein n=1 Tax=Geodermatophilus sp. DSM 44513 TaxID=1528104 RepID=UPI001412DB4F|nr:GAF and ANTAR domain-containing protein [Geodermatophilus sp. DSM 44513]WNV77203.1 GAF and ANTAR domain-containing protein [Geodermatophilus sp. DSM 44513]